MHELPDTAGSLLDAALGSDAELSEQLGPLLAGRYGDEAGRLVRSCLAGRVGRGEEAGAALLPALADAMRMASAGRDL